MNNTKVTNRILTQKSQAKGEERVFEIYNEKFIKIVNYNLLGTSQYHLNLSMLEPWPVRHRRISWRWLMGIVYSGITTLAYSLYLYHHPEGNTLGRLVPFVVVFILLTLGSLLMFLYRSPNVMEFRSRYGNCPLINLQYGNPSKDDFNTFVDELKKRILMASQGVKIDKQQMLNIELKELRRLTDDKILTERDFAKANNRALKMQI